MVHKFQKQLTNTLGKAYNFVAESIFCIQEDTVSVLSPVESTAVLRWQVTCKDSSLGPMEWHCQSERAKLTKIGQGADSI